MRSLRVQVPLLVIVVGALLALFVARASFLAQQSGIAASESARLGEFGGIVRDALEQEARRSLAVADTVAGEPEVAALLRAGDRPGLQAALQSTYDKLAANHGVLVMQFAVSPGTVFLRMHKPEHFGDDASGRPMVMLALGRGEPQSGVEIGSSGARVRGVVPIVDAQGRVGAAEIGVGFDPVLERVKTMTGFEIGAYLLVEGEPPADARMVGNYRELAITNRDALGTLVTPGLLDGVEQEEHSRMDVGGERVGVVRQPLLDFSGNKLGVIVGTHSLADLQSAENDALRRSVVLAIVQIVLLAGVVLIAFNGLLLRPVVRLTEHLGKGELDDATLLDRHDEIGELARAARKGHL
jgi:methyl-accepting chemotaxis protein